MKDSKTSKPATPKTVKDLPAKKPEAIKGGIVVVGGATAKSSIDAGYVGDPEELTYRTR